MNQETWKDIKGFEGVYQISNLSGVKRLSGRVNCRAYKTRILKEKILQLSINTNGYYYHVHLSINSKPKAYRVHRLLAIAFIANPDNKPEVNHKDGDKLNNSLDNLEWVTHRENGLHAYKTGLNYSLLGANNPLSKRIDQYTVDGEFIASYGSIHEASRETKIHYNTIGANLYGITKAVGRAYKFKYAA